MREVRTSRAMRCADVSAGLVAVGADQLQRFSTVSLRVVDWSGVCMASVTYDKELTALLVIDPYNDFISEGSKLWHRLKAVAEANDCVPHMLRALEAAR